MKWLLGSLILFQTAHADWTAKDQQIINEILPKPNETAWLSIPWRTSLWDARIEAARTGKPIYLWEMDGHPLGCT